METEIVQIPAIIKSGQIVICHPGFKNLSNEELQKLANTMGGQVAWIKYRATYSIPEQILCTHKECFALADKEDTVTYKCVSHKNKS